MLTPSDSPKVPHAPWRSLPPAPDLPCHPGAVGTPFCHRAVQPCPLVCGLSDRRSAAVPEQMTLCHKPASAAHLPTWAFRHLTASQREGRAQGKKIF